MKFLLLIGILITHGYSFLPIPRAGIDETGQIMNRLAKSKGPKEIVIVGHLNSSAGRGILDIVRRESHYNSVIIFKDLDALNDPLSKVAKWTKEHREINGKPTVFICENFTCKLPTSKIDVIRKLLNE